MNRSGNRRRSDFRPQAEIMEGRLLLSTIPHVTHVQLARMPGGHNPLRPNTPVLPFGSPTKQATFIDPTVHVLNGKHDFIGRQTYIAPYATLNSTSGFIKIGSGSFIGDNASIVSNPNLQARNPTTSILIGDNVLISYGATVNGPSVIGGYGTSGKPTQVGPNALIDGATIQPGAIVGALARVGPGVTVPSGMEVKPGANVTTNAEASDPKLGLVVPIPAADLTTLTRDLTNSRSLAAGYTTLYQGQSATGVSGITGVVGAIVNATASTGPFNGNLAAVRGSNLEPGAASLAIEPTGPTSPSFLGPKGKLVQAQLPDFPARVTGGARFHALAGQVAARLGHHNSIAADQGQPINLGLISQTGPGVTINSPLGGSLNIGRFFQAREGAVLLGGGSSTSPFVIGDQVTLGAHSVVARSSLGTGTVVGTHAYIADSNLPANSVVPDNAVIINNKSVGSVQW